MKFIFIVTLSVITDRQMWQQIPDTAAVTVSTIKMRLNTVWYQPHITETLVEQKQQLQHKRSHYHKLTQYSNCHPVVVLTVNIQFTWIPCLPGCYDDITPDHRRHAVSHWLEKQQGSAPWLDKMTTETHSSTNDSSLHTDWLVVPSPDATAFPLQPHNAGISWFTIKKWIFLSNIKPDLHLYKSVLITGSLSSPLHHVLCSTIIIHT